MSLKQYPPTYHRDVENLREELEDIHNLIQLCHDALELASVPELSHVTETLYKLAERAWSNIEPAKALETALFHEWTAKVETQRAEELARQQAQALAELPEEVIQAFEQVNAAYRASKQTEGKQP